MGVMAASVPPAIMTSASPRWMILKRIADGMRAGGAGGGRGFVRALGAEAHGDVAGRQVHDRCRNEEGGDLARAAFEQGAVFALDDVESADAGADVHADALGNFRRDFEAAGLHRLIGGSAGRNR